MLSASLSQTSGLVISQTQETSANTKLVAVAEATLKIIKYTVYMYVKIIVINK